MDEEVRALSCQGPAFSKLSFMVKCAVQSYVYIMASKKVGTLYVGVTSDLVKRVYEHKNGLTGGFTFKYKVHLLAYYEIHGDIAAAITREKQIKEWQRAWKIRMIERENPDWVDLYPRIIC